MSGAPRDHGGRLDLAQRIYGTGAPEWIDLSTGINPIPFPLPPLPRESWTRLPDTDATTGLLSEARRFWSVPDDAAVLAVPGLSAAIARIPALLSAGSVHIPTPTYNEHAAAFRAAGWTVRDEGPTDARVIVHPNNPDGRIWSAEDLAGPRLKIIDESFCDTDPDRSFCHLTNWPGILILKSFGKFWGLAGVRLGFVIGDPELVERLAELLGPWPVSGPALSIGRVALSRKDWAERTRNRLLRDAERLDGILAEAGARVVGGTSLFRLYHVSSAARLYHHLAAAHILTRTFPYSENWIRLGLPGDERDWQRLASVL